MRLVPLYWGSQVKPEELEVFDNVAYINASINSLSLGEYACIHYPANFILASLCASFMKSYQRLSIVFVAGSFSSFVSLRELNLSLNEVSDLMFDAAAFPLLEVR